MNYKVLFQHMPAQGLGSVRLEDLPWKKILTGCSVLMTAIFVYFGMLRFVSEHPAVKVETPRFDYVDHEIHTVPLPPSVIDPHLLVKELKEKVSHYSFNQAFPSLKRSANPHHLSEYSKREVRHLLLSGVVERLRPYAKPYIAEILRVSEKYQIDPFWVTSIMWTESHFNPKAKSRVRAQGLMQIMPGTSQFILKLMGRSVSRTQAVSMSQNPSMNIEMGVYYLNKLLKMFNGNHMYATVAYNMGPYWVLRRIRKGGPVGVKNLYLDKVRDAYSSLIVPFKKDLALRDRPWQKTLVVKNPQIEKIKKSSDDAVFSLFSFDVFSELAYRDRVAPPVTEVL